MPEPSAKPPALLLAPNDLLDFDMHAWRAEVDLTTDERSAAELLCSLLKKRDSYSYHTEHATWYRVHLVVLHLLDVGHKRGWGRCSSIYTSWGHDHQKTWAFNRSNSSKRSTG